MWYRFMCEISTARNNGLMSRANETWGICSPFSRPETSGSGFVACVKTNFHFALGLSDTSPRAPVVRRPQVGKLVKQNAVRPNLVCHVSARVHRKENIDNVVGQCPAIVRKARRAAREGLFVVGDQ